MSPYNSVSYFTDSSVCNDKGHRQFDWASFVENLLISRKLIFQSNRFAELPYILAGVGGLDGLKLLIESDNLTIHYDALTIGEIGQANLPFRIAKGLLPDGSFAFSTVQVTRESYETTVEKSLNELRNELGYGRSKFDSLKKIIMDHLTNFQGDDAKTQVILDQFDNDLGHLTNLIRHAIPLVAKEFGMPSIDKLTVELELERLDKCEYRAKSNLEKLLTIDGKRSHELIKYAGLRVGGLYVALFAQDYYDAAVDLNNVQQSILERHLAYLKRVCHLEGHSELAAAVRQVADIPQFDSRTRINIEKLVELKETDEYRQFIQAINSASPVDRRELRERVNSFKVRASNFLNTSSVKQLRFIIPSVMGLTGDPAMIATGLALGTIDHYLVKKVLPQDNIAFFIKKDLPSIFERDE